MHANCKTLQCKFGIYVFILTNTWINNMKKQLQNRNWKA